MAFSWPLLRVAAGVLRRCTVAPAAPERPRSRASLGVKRAIRQAIARGAPARRAPVWPRSPSATRAPPRGAANRQPKGRRSVDADAEHDQAEAQRAVRRAGGRRGARRAAGGRRRGLGGAVVPPCPPWPPVAEPPLPAGAEDEADAPAPAAVVGARRRAAGAVASIAGDGRSPSAGPRTSRPGRRRKAARRGPGDGTPRAETCRPLGPVTRRPGTAAARRTAVLANRRQDYADQRGRRPAPPPRRAARTAAALPGSPSSAPSGSSGSGCGTGLPRPRSPVPARGLLGELPQRAESGRSPRRWPARAPRRRPAAASARAAQARSHASADCAVRAASAGTVSPLRSFIRAQLRGQPPHVHGDAVRQRLPLTHPAPPRDHPETSRATLEHASTDGRVLRHTSSVCSTRWISRVHGAPPAGVSGPRSG